MSTIIVLSSTWYSKRLDNLSKH